MNPRYVLFFKLVGAVLVIVLLMFIFPVVDEFVGLAARELRYLWWLILLLLLAVWLIWGLGRKK